MNPDEMRAIVAIHDRQKPPPTADFDEVVHIAYDIIVNTYRSMKSGKVSKEYAGGVRDGVTLLLTDLVEDMYDVDFETAEKTVHKFIREQHEAHKEKDE